jgi:hypothetical protein
MRVGGDDVTSKIHPTTERKTKIGYTKISYKKIKYNKMLYLNTPFKS